MDDYVREFVDETEAAITTLNNLLLDLERSPDDDEVVQDIFRTAHTVKGNAGAMGLDRASDLAHAIEDVLDEIRAGTVDVSPERMDTLFAAVDCLERMVDEVARDGAIRTDPADVIASLREPLTDDSPDVTPPSTGEREAILTRFDPPANSAHDVYLVRMAIADSDELNNGLVVIEALVDAFDLIGTDPSRTAIENEEHGNRIDAVFAAAVDETAISAALEPVDAVEAFSILGVTDELESSDDTFSPVEENMGSDLSTNQANEMSVDDLLDEFTELDDIDALADEIDDTSEFEDIGDAGSFDDIIPESADEASAEDPEPAAEPAADDEDNVEDAGAVFAELQQEVDMVGFDELQDELEALEFDEFDEEEVGMDELLGEDVDVDDPAFLDLEDADPSDPVGAEAASADSSEPTWGAPASDEPDGGSSAEPDSTPASTADPDAGSAEGAAASPDATDTGHTDESTEAESSGDSSAGASESSAFADELFGGGVTDPADEPASDQPAVNAADTAAESGADGSGAVDSRSDADRADAEPDEGESADVAVAPPADEADVPPVEELDPELDPELDDESETIDEPAAADGVPAMGADEPAESESSNQPSADTDGDSSPVTTDLTDGTGPVAGDDADATAEESDGSTTPAPDPTPEPTDGSDESAPVDDEPVTVDDEPTSIDTAIDPIDETDPIDEFEGGADDVTESADETTATAPAAPPSDDERSDDEEGESVATESEPTPVESTDVGGADENGEALASSTGAIADEPAEPAGPSSGDAESAEPTDAGDSDQHGAEVNSASESGSDLEADADDPVAIAESSTDSLSDTAETAADSDDHSTDGDAPAFDLSTGLDELTQNEDSDEKTVESSSDTAATGGGDTPPEPEETGPSEPVAAETDATADPTSADDDADSPAEWLTEPLADEDGDSADEPVEARDSAASADDADAVADDLSAAPTPESAASAAEDDPEALGFDDATTDADSAESDVVSEPASSSDADDAKSDIESDDGFGDAIDDEPSSVGFGSSDESTVDLSGLEADADERSEDTELGSDDASDSDLDEEISFTDDESDETSFDDDLDGGAFEASGDTESTDTASDAAFDADLDLDSDDFGLETTPADEFDAESQSEAAFDSAGDQSDASFQPPANDVDTSGTDFDEGPDPEDEVLAGLAEMVVPDISVPTEASPDTDTDLEAHAQSVRVDREQVDSLLQLVEGLVTSRVRLRSAIESREPYETLERELDDLGDFTAELQETVMDVRLVPLQTVTNRLPRVVRDLAREQDKQVTFDQSNADVELDRGVLDRIGDPLIHLVRNAVDHGIESVESRTDAGKDPEGTIELSANRTQNRVSIEIADDGSGLDADRLRAEAVDADILTRAEADELSDGEAYDLVFNSGLSTKEQVTDVSGRGVGMDVVRRTVDELNGTVSITSEPGDGTTVTMTLPVSVAVDDVLFVESGGEQFGIPVDVVRDVADGADVTESDGELVYEDDEGSLPVVELSSALGVDAHQSSDPDGMLVRVRDDVRPVALKCDVVRTRREVVITPFEGFMRNVPGISGATVRGRGEVITILDVSTL